MKNEFVLAFNEVLEEKQLPREVIVEALEAALVSAYRRAVNASSAQHVAASIDLETGKVTIFAEKEIVDAIQDPRTEVSLKDARKVNEEADLGEMVVVETTPREFWSCRRANRKAGDTAAHPRSRARRTDESLQ